MDSNNYYIWSYEDFKKYLERCPKVPKMLISPLLTDPESRDFYSSLLSIECGATKEDFEVMTTEEKLAFIYLFGD